MYTIIGGQHIAKVMAAVYKCQVETLKRAEDDIPRCYRFVRATILKEGTPADVLRLAAGYHQRCQRATQDTKFSETCEGLLQMILNVRKTVVEETLKETKDPKEKKRLKEDVSNIPILLNSEQLWLALDQLGVKYPNMPTVDEMVCRV
jgi:hypothetical protein